MLLSHLKLSICHVHKDSNLVVPNSGYVVELIPVRPFTTALTASLCCRRKVSSLVTSVSLCILPHCHRDLRAKISAAEAIPIVESCLKEDSHLLVEQSLTEDARGDNNASGVSKSSNLKNEREMERRRKIGIANKGRVPWNKGRKHSEETREMIRRRTKEAMRDPKVRKKISECPRSLSNQTKERISMSHRKLWEQRLKWRRSREKIFQLWADSIAGAAKMGGSDQQELEWDSFEKIKREMHVEQLEWNSQRAKEKEATRLQAKVTANERLAKRKKEQEKKAKVARESKRKAVKKSKEDREDLGSNQEFKLRRNLMKIRKQKSRVSQISNQYGRTWENLDMKSERTEQNYTLADQIRLAKFKRAELSLRNSETCIHSITKIKRTRDRS